MARLVPHAAIEADDVWIGCGVLLKKIEVALVWFDAIESGFGEAGGEPHCRESDVTTAIDDDGPVAIRENLLVRVTDSTCLGEGVEVVLLHDHDLPEYRQILSAQLYWRWKMWK